MAATPPGVPAELLHAAVDALVSWRPHWPARPEVVVDFAAHGLPVAAAVADHVAAVGRLDRAHLPVNIAIEEDGASGSGPAEAAAWRSALTISSPLAQAIRGRCVLLVVDLTSSGWSLTIATAALREAGAEEVLPLLVHQGVGPALSARPN